MTTPTPAPVEPTTTAPVTPAPAEVDTTDWKAEAEKWKAHARKHEDLHKANLSAATEGQQAKTQLAAMLKAAGFNADGTEATDPETAASELADRLQAAQDRIWTLGVQTAMNELAQVTGADTDLLFHSTKFQDTLDDLVNTDSSTPEFRTALEAKMREFVTANPRYAAAAQSRFAGSADGGPRTTSTVAQISETDLKRMTPEQIVKARENGQLASLLGET